ncbi:hypothetical protein F511_25614 [Dorcoceras hygrometricum]|uniref:Uncharacterized protein n=1 Tax=Dorcoceras hygrometricum TaxID=472368 RepID=A0A2Z7C078_9LAMI|nr:hypothetical protein F511_25614 [Dorcoceras hygrometricum]
MLLIVSCLALAKGLFMGLWLASRWFMEVQTLVGRRLDHGGRTILEERLVCAFVRRMAVHDVLRSNHEKHGSNQGWSSWYWLDLGVVQMVGLRLLECVVHGGVRHMSRVCEGLGSVQFDRFEGFDCTGSISKGQNQQWKLSLPKTKFNRKPIVLKSYAPASYDSSVPVAISPQLILSPQILPTLRYFFLEIK